MRKVIVVSLLAYASLAFPLVAYASCSSSVHENWTSSMNGWALYAGNPGESWLASSSGYTGVARVDNTSGDGVSRASIYKVYTLCAGVYHWSREATDTTGSDPIFVQVLDDPYTTVYLYSSATSGSVTISSEGDYSIGLVGGTGTGGVIDWDYVYFDEQGATDTPTPASTAADTPTAGAFVFGTSPACATGQADFDYGVYEDVMYMDVEVTAGYTVTIPYSDTYRIDFSSDNGYWGVSLLDDSYWAWFIEPLHASPGSIIWYGFLPEGNLHLFPYYEFPASDIPHVFNISISRVGAGRSCVIPTVTQIPFGRPTVTQRSFSIPTATQYPFSMSTATMFPVVTVTLASTLEAGQYPGIVEWGVTYVPTSCPLAVSLPYTTTDYIGATPVVTTTGFGLCFAPVHVETLAVADYDLLPALNLIALGLFLIASFFFVLSLRK